MAKEEGRVRKFELSMKQAPELISHAPEKVLLWSSRKRMAVQKWRCNRDQFPHERSVFRFRIPQQPQKKRWKPRRHSTEWSCKRDEISHTPAAEKRGDENLNEVYPELRFSEFIRRAHGIANRPTKNMIEFPLRVMLRAPWCRRLYCRNTTTVL